MYQKDETLTLFCFLAIIFDALDNGSWSCKTGLSSETFPKVALPTCFSGVSNSDSNPFCTLERGIIKNWDVMEDLWKNAFSKLQVDPINHPVLLTEVPLNPKANGERATQVMFEEFQVPSLYVASQGVLPLYAVGSTTGIVVNCGHEISSTVPVYEGYTLPHAIHRINLAGRDLTDSLRVLLEQKVFESEDSVNFNILNDIKMKTCFVSDYQEEENYHKHPSSIEQKFSLPDGRILSVDKERFLCPELLFEPNRFGFDLPGIHGATYKSIMKTDMNLRKDLYNNIVLSGGSTLFAGFYERFNKEMKNQVPMSIRPKIQAPADRMYSTWIGGSILAELSTFSQMCMTRDEYDEYGTSYIYRKIF